MTASRLSRAFAAFHAANPHVFEKLREIAIVAAAANPGRRIGIALLFERLRWISQVETTGDRYRLNNNHRAFYARMLMEREPQLRGVFTTRQERTDSGYRGRSRAPRRIPRPTHRSRPVEAVYEPARLF